MKLWMHPDALLELQQALEWYDEQAQSADAFLRVVLLGLEHLQEYPLSGRLAGLGTRVWPLRRFPYRIHYFVDEQRETLRVLGVTHMARDAAEWNERLEDLKDDEASD